MTGESESHSCDKLASRKPICRIRVVEDEPSQKDARSKDAAQKDAKPNAVSAHLPRLFSAFEQARASGKNASKWLADALSLLAALQKLGQILAQLITRARRIAQQNLARSEEHTSELQSRPHLV